MQFGFGAIATPLVGLVLTDEPIGWLIFLGVLALVAPILLLVHNRLTPAVNSEAAALKTSSDPAGVAIG